MKFIRIVVLAACAAYGAIIGGANLAQATPMNGVGMAAPAVLTLEKPIADAFPVEKTYYYHRRHYYHPYYHRRYYHRHYHNRYYHHRYW
ncbi:hypothetical protein RZS28_19240 (plasmid) [Methylocapsa polymorpha]|uniref:Uncharacterized protein n=1 Tax=Methylocapsa polymorpha TaxID=3080828 RepID=A0ABZ0HWI5_9HYPH|nr:hypothetical protein [Methylocapsa sp. RX1]WOJ91603.1 hypothetical protein RZS28_19240 [Methylocapsa sp. RX1]